MDTTTGRFTSMDSYLGSVDDPVSLHKYLYVNANPVNYIDPSGYNSYGEMNLALKIQLILTDITTLKINMYCWYIRLGEASIGGKILKEVIDESFELLLEGDVDIYSVMWTGVEVVYGLADSEQEFSTLKKTTKSSGFSGDNPVDKVYYHVTTKERAQQIIDSGELGVRGNKWESRVFAWTKQPTKKQASIAGIGKDAQTVIKFNTKASFEPDKGNETKKSIADIVVQTTDGETVPILIKNVEIVGFKKEWWQFWKK